MLRIIDSIIPLSDVTNFQLRTIHGLLYVLNQNNGKRIRIAWLLTFLIHLLICLYQCKRNVSQYLKMDVKTSVTYEAVEKIEFPSITFCSTNPMKRSEFGNASNYELMLAHSLSMNDNEFIQLIRPNQLTCKSEHQSTFSKYIDKYVLNLLANGNVSAQDFYKLLAPTMSNFQTDVKKCWIEKEEVACDKVLINRPSDDIICFTYNMGNEFAKLFANTSLATNEKMPTNDGNANENLNVHAKSVRFLLKSNQSDYCGTGMIRRGAGYIALLTERDATPYLTFNSPINLSPGYINNVIIRPVQYKRKTEHLGLCRSQSNVFLVPSTSKYMQSLCYFQCIMGTLLKECKCYPANQLMFHDLFLKNVKNFNISIKDVRVCLRAQVTCARAAFALDFVDGSINRKCPECTPQCFENKYDYRLSRLQISVNQLKKYVSDESATEKLNGDELKRNYVDVMFSFENNYMEVVEESQALSTSDFFINIGNNMMLYLGMSFMSIFEIINKLILPLISICTRQLANRIRELILSKRSKMKNVRARKAFKMKKRKKKMIPK